MVIGLVAVGVVLVLLGIWIVRQTRADLEVLAPLERMGDGDWKKRDRSTQRRMLDEVRPDGAQPLMPSTQPPSLDDEFEQDEHPVTSFSDLGPGVASEDRDPAPAGLDEAVESDDAITGDDVEAGDEVVDVDEVDETSDEVDADAADEVDADAADEVDEVEVAVAADEVAVDEAAPDTDDDAAADGDVPSDEALSDPRP